MVDDNDVYSVDENGKMSSWNGGAFQILRSHKGQDRLSELWQNPTAFNFMFNEWNFNIIFNTIHVLYKEVRPKCSDKEKELGDKYTAAIEVLMMEYPILETKQDRTNNKSKQIINQHNWIVFKRWMNLYENVVRDFLEKHNMNAETRDESDMF